MIDYVVNITGRPEVGDWVAITNNANHLVTTVGSVGQIRTVYRDAYLVAFEPDTLTIFELRNTTNHSAEFIVSIAICSLIEPPAERIALIAEREAQRATCLAEQAEVLRIARLHLRAAENLCTRLGSSQRTSRTYTSYEMTGRRNLGEIVAKCMAEGAVGDEDQLLKALNDVPVKFTRSAMEALQAIRVHQHIDFCDGCGSYALSDNMNSTVDDEVCNDCVDRNYNYSECMDTYILKNDCWVVYDTARAFNGRNADDCCTERYGARNYFNFDGSFITDEDEYLELSSDGDDDGDDDDDNYRDDGLEGYHNSNRKFIEVVKNPRDVALGVELEVYSESRADSVTAAKEEQPDWYYEQDGSLDDSYGFELISQPMCLASWTEQAPALLEALSYNGARAYTQPNPHNSYGIHINIHRRHLTALQELRIIMFMQYKDNLNFLKAIAQREKLYGSAAIPFGSLEKHQMYARNVGGITEVYNVHQKRVRKPRSHGKYSALYMHDNGIAEFRLFQSTLNPNSFMKNLEFVQALVDWTSSKTASGLAYSHEAFIAWLAHPASETKYPNLMSFIRKPSFYGIGFVSPVKNTWNHLLLATTSKSLSIVTGDSDLRLAA